MVAIRDQCFNRDVGCYLENEFAMIETLYLPQSQCVAQNDDPRQGQDANIISDTLYLQGLESCPKGNLGQTFIPRWIS